MKKCFKRALTIVLALTMVLTMMNVSVAAAAATEVATADQLTAAIANGGEIKLTDDITVTDIVFTITKATVIDLNGKTISGKSTSSTSSKLFQVNAELTLKNGEVTFYATTPDTEWGGEGQPPFPGYANNAINCAAKLTLEDVKVENTTAAGGASYAIDCYPGANLFVEDGAVIDGCSKTAIRMFCNSATVSTNVTVNGGLVTGSRAIWVQLPGSSISSKKLAALTINGGTLTRTNEAQPAVYVYSYGDSFQNTDITITGGIFNGDVQFGGGANKTETENITITGGTFNGFVGRWVTSDIFAEFEVPYNSDDYVYVATADALRAAVAEDCNIVLVTDIEVDADTTITIASGKTVYLNLGGYTITGVSDQTGSNRNLFDVRGIMYVSNGTITVEHIGTNMGWNNSTNNFNITAGGELYIEDATIENLGGSDMNFCVHLNNWGEVTLDAENTVFKATYCPIRVFNSGYDDNNVTLKYCDLISGGNRAFWVHYYMGDFSDPRHTEEAVNARLKLDIFDCSNYYELSSTATVEPIRYGFNNTVYFSADSHTAVVIPAVEATCTTNGTTAGEKCADCGTVTKAPQVAAAYHDEYNMRDKAATCTADGYTGGIGCAHCGVVVVEPTVIPATGHTSVAVAGKDATCTQTGLTAGEKCSTCGATTVAQTTIAKLAHKYVDGKCSVCGEAQETTSQPTTSQTTSAPTTSSTTSTPSTTKPVVTSDGTTVKTDGSYVVADGTVVENDGTIVKTDGTVIKPDEAVAEIEETVVKVENEEEIKEAIPMTQEEETKVSEGAKVEVWVEVKDASATVNEETKKLITDAMEENRVGMFLDVDMFKQVVGENETASTEKATQLTKLNEKVTVSFELPKALIAPTTAVERQYFIVRVHEGVAELIPAKFDAATGKLSFETDRFSNYAVVYTDTVKVDLVLPSTGNPANNVAWISILLLAAGAALVLKKKQSMNA